MEYIFVINWMHIPDDISENERFFLSGYLSVTVYSAFICLEFFMETKHNITFGIKCLTGNY